MSESMNPLDWLGMNNWGAKKNPHAQMMFDNLDMAPGYDPSAALNGRPDFWSMDGAFGKKTADGTQYGGWGGTALNAAQGLGNIWMGMKQYGLGKDSLKENKRQFNLNYGAQKNMINSQLEDRQRARVASNPGAYQSIDSTMSQYGIK